MFHNDFYSRFAEQVNFTKTVWPKLNKSSAIEKICISFQLPENWVLGHIHLSTMLQCGKP